MGAARNPEPAGMASEPRTGAYCSSYVHATRAFAVPRNHRQPGERELSLDSAEVSRYQQQAQTRYKLVNRASI